MDEWNYPAYVMDMQARTHMHTLTHAYVSKMSSPSTSTSYTIQLNIFEWQQNNAYVDDFILAHRVVVMPLVRPYDFPRLRTNDMLRPRSKKTRLIKTMPFVFNKISSPIGVHTAIRANAAKHTGLKHWCIIVTEFNRSHLHVFVQNCVQADRYMNMVPIFPPCLVKIPNRKISSFVHIVKTFTATPTTFATIKVYCHENKKYIIVVAEYHHKYHRPMPIAELFKSSYGDNKPAVTDHRVIIEDIIAFIIRNSKAIALLAPPKVVKVTSRMRPRSRSPLPLAVRIFQKWCSKSYDMLIHTLQLNPLDKNFVQAFAAGGKMAMSQTLKPLFRGFRVTGLVVKLSKKSAVSAIDNGEDSGSSPFLPLRATTYSVNCMVIYDEIGLPAEDLINMVHILACLLASLENCKEIFIGCYAREHDLLASASDAVKVWCIF